MTAELTPQRRAQTLSDLRDATIVAVLRGPGPKETVRAVDALVAGGVRGIEVTYTTPGAADVIAEVRQRYGDEVVLGAGTIVRAEQAVEATEAGARFLVCPGTPPALAAELRATGAALLLGALTPTEVMSAVELGADLVKLFPASLGGPAYLAALRAPFPDTLFCPTGGVTPSTISAWLDAGAAALGAGGDLCSRAHMERGDWGAIEDNARRFREAARR